MVDLLLTGYVDEIKDMMLSTSIANLKKHLIIIQKMSQSH